MSPILSHVSIYISLSHISAPLYISIISPHLISPSLSPHLSPHLSLSNQKESFLDINAGIYFVRGNERTRRVFQNMLDYILANPDVWDQSLMSCLVKRESPHQYLSNHDGLVYQTLIYYYYNYVHSLLYINFLSLSLSSLGWFIPPLLLTFSSSSSLFFLFIAHCCTYTGVIGKS